MDDRSQGEATGKNVISEGIQVGLLGALAVAIWFLMVDSFQGTSFFTPAALGSVLFAGATGPEQIEVTFRTVGLYTVFHGAVFILIGILLSAAATAAERTPSVLAGALLLVVAFEAFFITFIAIIAQFLLGEFAWWAILGGNITAAIAMGTLLFEEHPEAAGRLTSSDALSEGGRDPR